MALVVNEHRMLSRAQTGDGRTSAEEHVCVTIDTLDRQVPEKCSLSVLSTVRSEIRRRHRPFLLTIEAFG